MIYLLFFFSSRRRHTICLSDWSSDVCSSDLPRRESRVRAVFFVIRSENAGPARTEFPRERLHPKRIWSMRFLQHWRTDTIRSEQSDQSRQCLMQLHGIAQCRLEKSKLLPYRT